MLKIIESGSWSQLEDQGISHVVPISSRGLTDSDRSQFFSKTAASEKFLHAMNDIKLADGEIPIHINAIGATEFHGCFAAGTPIAMGDGEYHSVESIRIGDDVLSADGNVCKVKSVFRRGVSKTIRIKVTGLADYLECSADHPFRAVKGERFICQRDKYKQCFPPNFGNNHLCKRHTKRVQIRSCVAAGFQSISSEWTRASDLAVGDFLVFTPPNIPVPIAMSVSEGYLYGMWLANGCFNRNRTNHAVSSIQISINAQYASVLSAIQIHAAKCGLKCHDYVYTGKKIDKIILGRRLRGTRDNERSISITGNPERFRIWHSLFNEHAAHKIIPPWVCSLPREVRLSIIAGYIDGDGAIVSSNKENRVTVGSIGSHLSLGFQRLCFSAGIAASRCRSKTYPNGDFWHVSISVPNLADVIPFSARITKRGAKQNSPTHCFWFEGKFYLRISEVSASGAADVYNFEVDGDHTYSGPNVDSHNCNRKGDAFSEQTCKDFHPTFVSEGKLYIHHQNSDPDRNFGKVASSCYNDKLHRIELLVIANGSEKAAKKNAGYALPEEFMSKIEKDAELAVSMGCTISHDVCSICGNKAKTRFDYCDEDTCKDPKTGEYGFGCRHGLAKVAEDGRIQYVDNIEPHFFDISLVGIPADRSAYGFVADYIPHSAKKSAAFDSPSESYLGIRKEKGIASEYRKEMEVMLHKLASIEKSMLSGQDEDVLLGYGLYGLENDIALGTKIASLLPDDRFHCFRLLSNSGVLLSPEAFAVSIGLDKAAGMDIRAGSDNIYQDTYRRYQNLSFDIPASVLFRMDRAAQTKSAELIFAKGLTDFQNDRMKIASMVRRGMLVHAACGSMASSKFRELAEAYALYKTASLCRFPKAQNDFSKKIAILQTLRLENCKQSV